MHYLATPCNTLQHQAVRVLNKPPPTGCEQVGQAFKLPTAQGAVRVLSIRGREREGERSRCTTYGAGWVPGAGLQTRNEHLRIGSVP